MQPLTVVTFSPDWGLPSTGPFALKLLKWLDIAGIPYVQTHEDNSAKGPKGKNPWVEIDGERIGDTEIVIAMLAARTGFDIDAGQDPLTLARNHAVRRMVEEHLHQVLEWELFVHPAGAEYIRSKVRAVAPPVVSGIIASRVCGHFARQLHARGIARHSDEVIARKGIADLDALEGLLGGTRYFGGERPAMADVSVFGLLAPMGYWPMKTSVADNLKSRRTLMAYLERMRGLGTEIRQAA